MQIILLRLNFSILRFLLFYDKKKAFDINLERVIQQAVLHIVVVVTV